MPATNKTQRISAAEYKASKGKAIPAAPVGKPSLWVGIDPGVHTGFAVWQPVQQANLNGMPRQPAQFIEVATYSAVEAVNRLRGLLDQFGADKLRVRIENPAGNKPTFGKDVAGAKMREKISQNVGSNKRDAQLMIEWLEFFGIPYDALTPRKKATGAGKITAEFFKGVPGFPGRSSQHGRDAAYLVLNI